MADRVPRVSVLMAVHNAARHLDQAMASVLSQTHGDFEFVIVEDAPTDETPAVLDRYACSDRRILRLRNQRQLGLPASLNRGLARCAGSLIARIDGDDVCERERFAAQVAWLENHPEAGGCGTWTTEIDDAGQPVGVHRPLGHPHYIRWAMTNHNVVYHPTAMLRRDVLERLGGYDEQMRYAQDYDLFTRILAAGHQLGVVEKPLLLYRRSGGSITATRQAEQEELGLGARTRYIAALLDRQVDRQLVDISWRLLAWRDVEYDEGLAPALRLILELRNVCSKGASPEVRRAIDAEIALHLERRAALALRDRPEATWRIAAALRPLTGLAAQSRRLRLQALRCMLGRRLRGRTRGRAANSVR